MSERAIEIPKLLEFIKQVEGGTLLDVGCRNAEYIDLIRPFVGHYVGLDVQYYENNKLDAFYHNDFIDDSFNLHFDTIISVSTIEHIGLNPLNQNDLELGHEIFIRKLVDLALKSIFVTFPFGKGFHENEFRAITGQELESWSNFLPNRTKVNFYYSDKPNELNPIWQNLSFNAANNIIYDKTKGVQCVCILRGHK